MSILYSNKNLNTGLGDKLVNLHRIVANSTAEDTIFDSNYDRETLYFKSKLLQKRTFINSKTKKCNIPYAVDKDLTLFEPGSNRYNVYVEWPKLHKYNFFDYVAHLDSSKDKDRLIKHLLKRSFLSDWALPKREGLIIRYNEKNIDYVFKTVKHSKIVYGAEGGIYHLAVYFNKPFVMIIPDQIIKSDELFRNLAFSHIFEKHPTYQHRFISESLFMKYAYV